MPFSAPREASADVGNFHDYAILLCGSLVCPWPRHPHFSQDCFALAIGSSSCVLVTKSVQSDHLNRERSFLPELQCLFIHYMAHCFLGENLIRKILRYFPKLVKEKLSYVRDFGPNPEGLCAGGTNVLHALASQKVPSGASSTGGKPSPALSQHRRPLPGGGNAMLAEVSATVIGLFRWVGGCSWAGVG